MLAWAKAGRYTGCSSHARKIDGRTGSENGPHDMGLTVTNPIRFSVLVADGDQGFCEMVTRHLRGTAVVVGAAADGNEAVSLADRLHPDIVLMDVAVPLLGGAEAARRIKAGRAETKVVLLTSGSGDRRLGPEEGAPGALPVYADALLPKKSVVCGILAQGGRPDGSQRKPSAGRRAEAPARRRRVRR